VGVGLWRNLDRPLQLLTALAGAGLTLVGLIVELDLESWQAGLIVWASGLALGTLAVAGFLEPRTFTIAVASAVAWFGAMTMMDWNDRIAPAVAAATAALAVVAGTRERLVPVLVVGVLAFLIAIEALLSTTFSGAGSAMVVAVIGLIVVAVAVTRARPR
jgi:FtsH-binding integral membrane protein